MSPLPRRSAPKRSRAVSVPPEPINPVSASTSPRRMVNDTSRTDGSRDSCLTTRRGAPMAACRFGNSWSSRRPTIIAISDSRLTSPIGLAPTCWPSRSTVTRSVKAKISSSRWLTWRTPMPCRFNSRTSANSLSTSADREDRHAGHVRHLDDGADPLRVARAKHDRVDVLDEEILHLLVLLGDILVAADRDHVVAVLGRLVAHRVGDLLEERVGQVQQRHADDTTRWFASGRASSQLQKRPQPQSSQHHRSRLHHAGRNRRARHETRDNGVAKPFSLDFSVTSVSHFVVET